METPKEVPLILGNALILLQGDFKATDIAVGSMLLLALYMGLILLMPDLTTLKDPHSIEPSRAALVLSSSEGCIEIFMPDLGGLELNPRGGGGLIPGVR